MVNALYAKKRIKIKYGSFLPLFDIVFLPHGEHLLVIAKRHPVELKFYIRDERNKDWAYSEQLSCSNIKKTLDLFEALNGLSLLIDHKGHLVLYLSGRDKNDPSRSIIVELNSPRYGKEWEKETLLNPDSYTSWKLAGPPISLFWGEHMGSYLLPIDDLSLRRTFLLHSYTTGSSWSPSLYIEPFIPEDIWDTSSDTSQEPHGEQALTSYATCGLKVVENGINSLIGFCFFLPEKKIGWVESEDAGQSWKFVKFLDKISLGNHSNFLLMNNFEHNNPLDDRNAVITNIFAYYKKVKLKKPTPSQEKISLRIYTLDEHKKKIYVLWKSESFVLPFSSESSFLSSHESNLISPQKESKGGRISLDLPLQLKYNKEDSLYYLLYWDGKYINEVRLE